MTCLTVLCCFRRSHPPVVLLALLTACSSGSSTKPTAPTESVQTESVPTESAVHTLTPAQWRQIGVTRAALEPVHHELHLTGVVTVNQDKEVKVFPLVGGHVQTVRVELGDRVRAGQVLAVIQSGDVADLDQQAVTARTQLTVAQKNLQVTQDMAGSGLASQRDLITAREQVLAATGEVNRVGERQRILGSNHGSLYVVKAPVDGFVVERRAAQGQELRSDDPDNLFTIANLDPVWVMADVYESDLANVREGEPVTVTTLAYPDRPLSGRIDKVFNVLDPDSRTEKVRITLPNQAVGERNVLLKPDMFANVTVRYASTEQKVAVPANALIFDNSRNYVIVAAPNRQLQVREVLVDQAVGPKAYVSRGLRAGETIVCRNQLLAYNALGR